MRQTYKISGLLAALLLAWGQADAAGLGRLSVQSALGQPLKAEIELYSVAKDELPSINAKLANVDAFRQARIERLDALNNLRFSVDSRPNGQPIIRVSSSTPINDPFLDLLIELNWPSGRLLREYTLLLDPPVEAKPAQAERPAPPAPPVTAAPVVSKPAAAEKPAEMAKSAKEEAKPAKPEKPVAKEYGPVKKGETLRSIAGKLKPEGSSTEQMMVGLYQANKDAFLGGNMNRLKKGEVLKVPEFESLMLEASPSQARQMIQEQAAEWHAARAQAPAKEVAAEPAKDKAVAAGKIEPAKPATQPATAAPAKDVLKLSKGEPVTAGKPDAKTTERLHALEEDLAAKSRALKEAQDRVAQLEKTVKDLQRLVELKAQQPVAVPVPEAAKPVAPAEPVAQAEAPKPVAPAPQPAPETKPEPGLLDSLLANPLYLGGGLAGVLLLVLLGISVARRRRQKQPSGLASLNTGLFGAGASVAAAATAAPTAARPESSVLTDFSRLGLGAIDTQEIDPIAEAEVYLAYGKDAQAEEILRDALHKNPGREDILLKLLEIYHGRKDIATFEATARDLQTALGGDTMAASWTKAAGMGREIDPANPLYELPAAAAGMVAAAPESTGILDMEMPAMEAPREIPAEEAPTEPAPSVLPPGLDFEFSMATPSAAEPEAESAPAPAEPSPADAAPGLDFSADLMATPEAIELPEAEPMAEVMAEMPAEPFAAEPAEEAAASPAAEMALPDLDFGGLDLELKEPELPAEEAAPTAVAEAPDFMAALEPESAATEPAASVGSGLPDLDFGSLDMALKEPGPAEPAADMPAPSAEAAAPEMELPDLDFGSLDLNVNEVEAASAAEAPAEIPAMENDELWAEVNTKLDLARAYIEMGDKEGAREILQEVLAEGNSQQAAEANKLLSEAV